MESTNLHIALPRIHSPLSVLDRRRVIPGDVLLTWSPYFRPWPWLPVVGRGVILDVQPESPRFPACFLAPPDAEEDEDA